MLAPTLALLMVYSISAGALLAAELPAPAGPIILTVSGNINQRNSPEGAAFDREMLESLGLAELRTSTAWTEGVPVFEGVPAAELLEAVDAKGDRVVGRALNDYESAIPLSDFTEFPVLLALKMNGRDLRIREGGPIWIVYPWDQYPELVNEETKHRSVWQLNELHVE
jgi:hypothetical protein